LVERLQGEADEQQRLKVILQTLSGELGVQEASARLGIRPQRFDMLRGQVRVTGLTLTINTDRRLATADAGNTGPRQRPFRAEALRVGQEKDQDGG
jgi:hypothetical protein